MMRVQESSVLDFLCGNINSLKAYDQWGACHHFLLPLKHVFKEAAVLLARKIIYCFRIKSFFFHNPRRRFLFFSSATAQCQLV